MIDRETSELGFDPAKVFVIQDDLRCVKRKQIFLAEFETDWCHSIEINYSNRILSLV